MKPLGNLVKNLLFSEKQKYPFSDIFLKWEEIVGYDIAEISEPVKVINMINGNVLLIKVKGTCAVETQHNSLKIIKAINDYLGNKTFVAIRVIQEYPN